MENHTHGRGSPAKKAGGSLNTNIERAFLLASEVINLERKLSESLHELTQLVNHIEPDELLDFLLALMRQPGVADSVLSTLTLPPVLLLPEAKKASGFYDDDSWKGKVVVLMQDGRERKSERVIRQLRATGHKSAVYQALTDLTTSGVLVRTGYAHYQLQKQ